LQNDALSGFAQNILLEPGATYEVKCYCKTDNLNGIALPYLNINNSSLLLEYGIIPISGTTDWYEAKARFVSPNAASNATFFFFVQGSGGTAYLDEVSFTKFSNQGNAAFQVSLQNEAGTIRPFMDVNAGPINPPFSQNLSSSFETLGISSVRTHDFYGPCDIHTIFPDFNADVNDPSSYHFEETDEVIAAIIATGADVMFRLGESFSGSSLYNAPPSNNQKMADICKNIVRHYNDGWNNGFNYGIEHWEIWNEPDLYHFWSGTALEFTTMYGVIANTLKTYNPNLKIIGPAVSSMVSEWFVDEFLAGVSQFNYPLDGFSYHMYYMANLYGFAQMDERVEQKLAQYGLEAVPHYLTEWNNYAYSSNGSTEIWRNDPFSGASTAASLIYLQETELEQAHRYRANEFLFGLFDDNSSITYSGMAYQQFSGFADHSNRLTTTGGDSLGLAILAGRNNSGSEMLLSVADNSSAHNSYSIQLNGLANNETYTYTQWRIDSTYTNQLISTGVFTAQAPFVLFNCSSPFVDKLLLEQQTVDNVEENVPDVALKV
jgi:xylan 1,4-beta-xylosidase